MKKEYLQMKDELSNKLVEKYPSILREYGGDPRHTCMAWGFECGDGWFKILETLCEQVNDIPGFRFDQVKEKFGALRIYFSCDEDHDKAQKFVDEAEIQSTKVCEICGKPGKTVVHRGWFSTECNMCKAIRDAQHNAKDLS